MKNLIAPIIHSNGTGRDELVRQYRDILDGCRDLMAVMRSATPNGRDYYPISPSAGFEARDAYNERYNAVSQMHDEFEGLALQLQLQLEAKKRSVEAQDNHQGVACEAHAVKVGAAAMAGKKKLHVCENEYRAEGARGGCYFEISQSQTNPEVARLNVGWSCVVVHQKEIPVSWLSELLAIATAHKDGVAGFLAEHNYGGGYALMCDPPESK